MLTTLLVYVAAAIVIAALAIVALGCLLMPVYLWLLHRDAVQAPEIAAELARIRPAR